MIYLSLKSPQTRVVVCPSKSESGMERVMTDPSSMQCAQCIMHRKLVYCGFLPSLSHVESCEHCYKKTYRNVPNSDVDNGGAEPKPVGVGIFRFPRRLVCTTVANIGISRSFFYSKAETCPPPTRALIPLWAGHY
jgi:hypothetical protein